MCEIAILDTQQYSPGELKAAAVTLYESMGPSLGVVAVHDNEEEGRFDYDIYKAVVPDREDVFSFVDRAREEGAFRLIIHGRLATHGEINKENAHPIEIDCSECDIDYLLHNGVISTYRRDKSAMEELGHEFSTDVDSEVIAHAFQQIPDGFDTEQDLDHYSWQPAYILLSEDKVFIHGRRYRLSNRGTMAHGHRDFGPDRSDEDYESVILSPSNA